MSLSRFLSVIVGRRTAFLAALGLVVALVLLGTYLMPPRYTASAQVMVEGRSPAAAMPTISSHLATEAELLVSERVSASALRLLGLDKDPALKKKWTDATGGRGDFDAWAAEQLLDKLDVKPSRDSNILTIAYSSPDPDVAAKTVNAFLKAYVDTTHQIREESAAQTTDSFGGRTKNLKTALAQAEEALARFQRENGVAFTDERLDIENLRLADLNTQLVLVQSAAAQAAGRQRQAAVNQSGMEEVLRDPLVASLSGELARQESRLVELRTRAGEQHPAVVEQRDTLRALRSRLDAATSRASSSIGVESRIAAERAGSLQAALDAQRAKVMQTKVLRDQARRLQQDLELARRAYDAAVIRASETALESGSSRGNVSVVKVATVPGKPASPRPMVNLVASIVMGLLAAVAAAFWRESRDRRLRLDQEVYDMLEQPLLGVLSSGRPAVATRRLAIH
ncbi:MAG TPA: GNVR domain-containing protein [Ramlibacter sp.]|nr:GNVR domain-containing protein [Ramlibacter sp.]